MADFGYDLAGESVALFQQHEMRVHETIEVKNQEIEKLVTEMEELEWFLSLLANGSDAFTQDGEHSIEVTGEDVARIKRLSDNPDLRHIFPPTKFSWMEGEIAQVATQLQEKLGEWANEDNMRRMVTQRVEGPLQRKISMKSEEIMLEQHDLTKAVELFNRGLQRMLGLNERILSNMQRMH